MELKSQTKAVEAVGNVSHHMLQGVRCIALPLRVCAYSGGGVASFGSHALHPMEGFHDGLQNDILNEN